MSDRERPSKDKTQVVPEPSNPIFFKWLEQLFVDEKPEKLEVRQAFGPGARKHGPIVIHKDFKPGAPKPQREALVALSNELIEFAQADCDALAKPHRYRVLAKHHGKGVEPYQNALLSLTPKQPAPDGYDAHAEEDEEAAGGLTDAQKRDALMAYSLEHLKQGNEHERYRQDQFSTSMGDLITKLENLLGMTMGHLQESQKENRELFKVAEEALSKKAERDLATRAQEFKFNMMGDAFQFLKQMAPVAVNQLTGKQTIPTSDSSESIAVRTFLEGLSSSQATKLFGEFDEATKEMRGGGIFSVEQARIFGAVARCELPPSALDGLIDGEHAVTETQVSAATAIVSMNQLMPLMALVMERRKKNQAAQSASPEMSQQPSL